MEHANLLDMLLLTVLNKGILCHFPLCANFPIQILVFRHSQVHETITCYSCMNSDPIVSHTSPDNLRTSSRLREPFNHPSIFCNCLVRLKRVTIVCAVRLASPRALEINIVIRQVVFLVLVAIDLELVRLHDFLVVANLADAADARVDAVF